MTDKHTLVERLEYTAEHGIFCASTAGMLASYSEAATRITALEAREAELVDAGTFLLARLDELEWLDGQLEDTARDYMGHVDPAVDRFRATLAKHQGEGK